MHTHLRTTVRLGLAAGLLVAGSLVGASPALAVVDLAPNATLTSTSGCQYGGEFLLTVTLSNPGGGAAATFFIDAETGQSANNYLPVQVSADDEVVWYFTFLEGFAGNVHITSSDHTPVIDFLFEMTADCVPDDEVTTTEVVQIIPTGLPETGPNNAPAAALALGLVVVGGWMTRLTRRAR